MTTSKNDSSPVAASRSPRQSAKAKACQTGIAQELQKLFDDVVNEPVPDNFMDLLRRLDSDDGNQK